MEKNHINPAQRLKLRKKHLSILAVDMEEENMLHDALFGYSIIPVINPSYCH
jgi:hypothetical protein